MVEGYEHRTAVTRLEVNDKDRRLLEETIDNWRQGCQIAVNEAWDSCDGKREVQSLAYDEVRSRTSLGSQHAILATHQAATAISSCLEQRRTGKNPTRPEFTAPTVKYDARTMTLFDDYSVSLATIKSRVRCDLSLPEDPEGYQFEYLTDKDWELTESTLTIRDGKFFLHLGFRQPTTSCGQSTAENGTVLGVDLGVENLAVTSTARFFSGRKLNHERREFEKRRGELQQVGTRSAHRTLKQVAEREKRYVRDYLHRTSKQVVDEARQCDCTTIVFEDLSDIRESIPEADWFHIWAFRRLFEYTRYKAKENGIKTVQIDPTHTSQQCSECGHVAKTNRPRRNHFHCEKCGTQANADYNAAKNIGLRFVRRGQQSSRRTGTGQCALKSGTLAPDGNFSPYPTNS